MARSKFIVPGPCLPYPRASRNGKRTFKPRRFEDYQHEVMVEARQAWLGKAPLEGPVALSITFVGLHGNSDIDNAAKTILDALQGIFYHNDKQVKKLDLVSVKGQAETRVSVEVLK